MEDKIKWEYMDVTAGELYSKTLSYGIMYGSKLEMPRMINHGDIDRVPNCYGWWIHVELDEVTGDPVSADMIYVITPATYRDFKGEELLIDSLPKENNVYVFLW